LFHAQEIAFNQSPNFKTFKAPGIDFRQPL
jgi:hypothetical protein